MKSAVTRRGQTVIPAQLRRRYRINKETRLEWIDTGEEIRVVPLPEDIIKALRGSAKGENLARNLLKSRHEDRLREKRR